MCVYIYNEIVVSGKSMKVSCHPRMVITFFNASEQFKKLILYIYLLLLLRDLKKYNYLNLLGGTGKVH